MTNMIHVQRYDNDVYVLTFNRPEAHNALTLAMMHTFRLTINKIACDKNLRVLVLTGAGERAFCSGGDLVELSKRPSEADGREMIVLMGDALLALEQLPVPVLGAINGYALGGGSEIALACDMRIVDADVKMGFAQIHNALTPGWGAGQRLLRLVGYADAMELLLTGQRMDADELKRRGLANRVTEAGQALPAALAFAEEIANKPPDVVRGIKALLQAGRTKPYLYALEDERDIFPPLWAAEPHLQAVERFLQRQSAKQGGTGTS